MLSVRPALSNSNSGSSSIGPVSSSLASTAAAQSRLYGPQQRLRSNAYGSWEELSVVGGLSKTSSNLAAGGGHATSRYAALGLGGTLHFPKVGGKRARALGNVNANAQGPNGASSGAGQSSQYYSPYYRPLRDENNYKENVYRVGGTSNGNGVSKLETSLSSSHFLSGQTILKDSTHHGGGSYLKESESGGAFKESTRANKTQAQENGFGSQPFQQQQQQQGSSETSSKFHKKYSKDLSVDGSVLTSITSGGAFGTGAGSTISAGAPKEKESSNGKEKEKENGERSGTRSKSIKSAHHSNGAGAGKPRVDAAGASSSSHGQRSETPDSTTKQPLSKKTVLSDANGNMLPLSGRSTHFASHILVTMFSSTHSIVVICGLAVVSTRGLHSFSFSFCFRTVGAQLQYCTVYSYSTVCCSYRTRISFVCGARRCAGRLQREAQLVRAGGDPRVQACVVLRARRQEDRPGARPQSEGQRTAGAAVAGGRRGGLGHQRLQLRLRRRERLLHYGARFLTDS